MKVLLSAYACEPGGGSETGKGWQFAMALARHGCDVTVLTCGSHHRAAIERFGPCPNLQFIWHDVPLWRGPGYDKARFIRQHYLAWQITARRRVRQVLRQRQFDVIHHLTWTVLRWPSFLGGLGPRFVFGPVGGGESAPKALRVFPERAVTKERVRDALNTVSRFDPMVRRCLKAADVILVTDAATRRHVAAGCQAKTHVIADIYAPEVRRVVRPPRAGGPRLLFAGRLEYWKGVQLAIGALAHLAKRMPDARLTVAGSGPDREWLERLARERGVYANVDFVGAVPHDRMPDLYAAHDIFLFPSLHDSGPHVIGEALSQGLPVVCLDLGGPGVAIGPGCGIAVRADQGSEQYIHARLAKAVEDIVADPDRLAALQQGAYARAADFAYSARVADMVERFYTP